MGYVADAVSRGHYAVVAIDSDHAGNPAHTNLGHFVLGFGDQDAGVQLPDPPGVDQLAQPDDPHVACGPSCVAAACAACGRADISAETIIQDIGVGLIASQGGTDCQQLVNALAGHGIGAHVVGGPAGVHVPVMNPVGGVMQVDTLDSFDDQQAGVEIFLTPGGGSAPAQKPPAVDANYDDDEDNA